MIKNYLKWYILLIFIIFSMIIIPFSFSKYTTTLSKALTLNIESIDISYFKEYNGSNDFLGFDKTNITSFERNTTLTKEEVLEKENVQLISSEENDEYKSSKEIYGWVEDNHFYWWSEALKVYFHPQTMNAFYNMKNLVYVDLNGTSTSKVENFSSWFANDQSLATINGKINTSGLILEYKTSTRNVSFYRMFYKCLNLTTVDLTKFNTKNATDMVEMFSSNNLKELDLSSFDTSNVTNMGGMFNSCYNLIKLNLSNFDTSNVKNMSGMFAYCKNLKELDLSSFDTSNVTNMSGMFAYCKNLNELDLSSFDTSNVTNMATMFQMDPTIANYNDLIVLGNKFNTSKVTNMDNMFFGIKNLKVIYTKNDFIINENTSTTNMFHRNNSIIGGYGTEYKTIFDENHIDGEYAKISNENQTGYFTYYESIDDIKFNITYNLNGGSAINKNFYYTGSGYALINPVKEGYIFVGWTGSNGNIVEKNITIEEGDRGNKHYVANYIEDNELSIPGPCTFNGSGANITGDNCRITLDDGTVVDYTNGKYIDTGMYLYNEANYQKDYEISFVIDDWDSTLQVKQGTLMNSKYENSKSKYPGITFRRNNTSTSFEITQTLAGTKEWNNVPYTKGMNVKILRQNGIIYYQVNNGELSLLQDINGLIQYFDVPVWFGAAPDANNNPQRYFIGTLSNIKVKIGE